MLKQVRLYLWGDVIGVGFRAWTKIQAKITGVNGWVRNADYRTVETVIQGEEEKVKKMVELLKQGPPVAKVEKNKVVWEKPIEIFNGFEIRK